MAGRAPSVKAAGWKLLDRVVARAAPDGVFSNPWCTDSGGTVAYRPDFATLSRLLGVPLHLRAATQTGVPALALDVWLAYEMRRSGFDRDAVWPRATPPRVLPVPLARLIDSLQGDERRQMCERLGGTNPPKNVAPSQAVVLGKNYTKQVDVVMSNWQTGPELMISTKRMDSSFGKNAPNRIEEAYGDAKNLRSRHPLAALGFFFGIRSTVFEDAPAVAAWLVDLMRKLGEEDDAYHSVCLLPMEYDDDRIEDEAGQEATRAAGEAGLEPLDQSSGRATATADEVGDLDAVIAQFPDVRIREELVPPDLRVAVFLQGVVDRVLRVSPVTLHAEARRRRSEPRNLISPSAE